MSRQRLGFSLVLASCASTAALGELITPESQTRTVSASAGNNNQQNAAVGFGEFNDSVDAGLSSEFASVDSTAGQISTITKDKIAVFATAETLGYGQLGSAASICTVVFSLADTVDFSLTGDANFIDLGVQYEATRLVRLTGPNTNIEFASYDGNPASMPVDASGQLEPGTYTFELVASVTGNPVSNDPESPNGAYVDFEVSLAVVAVPEPAAALLFGAGLLLMRRR